MRRTQFIAGAIWASVAFLVPTKFASSRETDEPANKDFAKRSAEYNELTDYPSYLLQAYYEAHPEEWDSTAYSAATSDDTETSRQDFDPLSVNAIPGLLAVIGVIAVAAVVANQQNTINSISGRTDQTCASVQALGTAGFTALTTAQVTALNLASATTTGTRLQALITELNSKLARTTAC